MIVLRKLILLDLDGVLVKIKSSWEYMHRYFGSSQDGIFERYFNLYREGRISYQEWMKADIEHLLRRAGRPIYRRDLEEAFSKVEIYGHSSEIADLAVRSMAQIAIVSGGINILASLVARRLGIRYVYSNILVFDEEDTLIPGGIPVVEPMKKGYVVRKIARIMGIDQRNSIYIGDSIWDFPAFQEVGTPILYNEQGDEEIFKEARKHGLPLDRIAIARDSDELLKILYRAIR
jgi:phosphoserine phosphatase